MSQGNARGKCPEIDTHFEPQGQKWQQNLILVQLIV